MDGRTGKVKPLWESYFSGVWTLKNKEAQAGSFTASSMENFTKTVNAMLTWCAVVLGLPTRYLGQEAVNPAAEGAIKADEARLVKNCERKGVVWGNGIGQVMGLAKAILTGEDVNGHLIKVEWHDPSTPTLAQKADALQKLSGGKAILSREGVWDEQIGRASCRERV